MRKIISAVVVASMLAGCATANRGMGAQYVPIVDIRPGQSQAQLDTDIFECQQHAHKIMDAASAAMAGAIAGALLGAALGAAAGGHSRQNMQLAGVGALSGGVSNAASAEGGQRGIVMRCLAGRGYSVLG